MIRPVLPKYRPIVEKFILALTISTVTAGYAVQSFAVTIYNPAASFEAGWKAKKNPNSIWSYGHSLTFGSAISLYDQTIQNGINGPNAQYWLAASDNFANSPSAEYNDGSAFDNGNVNFLKHQFILVSGIDGEASDLVFTAPATGTYSLKGKFRGDQHGIGVATEIYDSTATLFQADISQVAQTKAFDLTVSMQAGDSAVFAVAPNGGLQNTGLNLSIQQTALGSGARAFSTNAVPEPATWVFLILGATTVGGTLRTRRKTALA